MVGLDGQENACKPLTSLPIQLSHGSMCDRIVVADISCLEEHQRKHMSTPIKRGLIERQGLVAAELSEIKHLAHLCNQHEGLDMKLVWSLLRERPTDQVNDFLYYADDQLVGFLALFTFNSYEAEVSGMVHPAYRQRGIFSTLFETARQRCGSRGLSTLLLIVEQASPAGQTFVRHLSTTYDHSEYKMVLQEACLPDLLNEHLHL